MDPRPPFPQELYPCRDLSGLVSRSNPGYSTLYGGNADIWPGTLNDGNGRPIMVAIKVLRSNRGDGYVAWEDRIRAMKRHLIRETSVWSVLDHENVLKFLGIDPTNGYPGGCPALISPYCKNGTVTHYLRQNPGVDRLLLLKGIALGLEYLHSREVVHGDLKPCNVLIGDFGQPLLCDFGCSKILCYSQFTATQTKGTCRYQAPEILWAAGGQSVRVELTKPSDVYAYAMTSFEVLTSLQPFYDAHKDSMVIIWVIKDRRRPQCPDFLPPAWREGLWPIIESCWSDNVGSRPPMSWVVRQLTS